MNATQIGKLAVYIETAIRRNPVKSLNAMKRHDSKMDTWEKEVRDAIDKDGSLPDYDEIPDEIIESLVEWLEESLAE